MSIAFLLTTLVVVATPGTGVVYTLAAALSRGRRASVVAAVGCTLGIVPHLLATVTGVAALLHASATAFQVLKYAGVAYLLYMAWATVRDKEALVVAEREAAPQVSARCCAWRDSAGSSCWRPSWCSPRTGCWPRRCAGTSWAGRG